MLTVRKKISADPLTAQDIQDRKDGITDIKTSDIFRTEMSDQAAADGKVKTTEESYKTWIRDAFKQRQKEIRNGDEAYGNIAVTIANKCR